MPKMILKNSNNVWSGHTKLDIAQFIHQYDDGEEISLKREILKAPDSVVVLLYRQDNHNLILTSQWRAPVYYRGDDPESVIEACAGNIDPEDIQAENSNMLNAAKRAVVREVIEETGWHINQIQYLYALYSSPGISTEKLYYFIACVDKKMTEGGGLRSEGEDIAEIEIPLEVAIEYIHLGKIKDLKTVTLIQYLQINKNNY